MRQIYLGSRELSDLDVRVYGNTAVVTGQVAQKSTNNGIDTSGHNRFTRVYVKQNGRWGVSRESGDGDLEIAINLFGRKNAAVQ